MTVTSSVKRPVVVATATVLLVTVVIGGVLQLEYSKDPYSTSLISDAMSYEQWARKMATDGIAAEPVFHQSPLFPVALSWLYPADPGPGAPPAFPFLQILLISTAIALLVPIGKLHLGSVKAGSWAAAVALLHGPFLFHSLKILPVSMALASQAAVLALLGMYRSRPGMFPALAAGALSGIAALTRAEFLLFVPVAIVIIAIDPPAVTPGRRVAAIAVFTAALALTIAPVTAHNAARGDTVLIASAGGENLFVGNQRGGSGSFKAIHPRAGDIFSARILAQKLAEEDTGRELRPSEVSSYWRDRAIAEVLADPAGWLRLEVLKLGRILHPGDPSDMYSFALERRHYLPLLYATFLPAGFVIAAGIVGLAFAWHRKRRDSWPLAAFFMMHLSLLLVFFVSTRIRLPMIYSLAPFAGFAIFESINRFRNRKSRVLQGAVLLFVLIAGIAGSVMSKPSDREQLRLGAVLTSRGEYNQALEVLAPVVRRENPYPSGLDQAGSVLQRTGRFEEAERMYVRALELGLTPDKEVSINTRLAMVLEEQGRTGEAASRHDIAAGSPAANAGTYYERGVFRLRHSERAGALADFRRAVELDPRWDKPRLALQHIEQ